MKKTKIFTLMLCTVLLSVGTVLGTLAYLTSRDSVTNTFTVGKVKIELHETKTDENGNPVYDESACPAEGCTEDQVLHTTEGNNYHVVPGETYLKDPTVTVKADSEASYVRMVMTVHNASAVQAIIDADNNLTDYADLFAGWDTEAWVYTGFVTDAEANTISFEFRYKEEVAGAAQDTELPALFTELVVPGSVTNEQLEALYNGQFKVVVEAHAIQSATFADADAAWEAFDAQTGASN